MVNKKVLILKSQQDSFEKYYSNKMCSEEVDVFSVYRFNQGIFRFFMIIWIQKLRMPFQHIWYGKWKKSIQQYDTIIVFDRILDYNILKYIKKRNKSAKLNFWYWNIIQKTMPDSYKELCDAWTFDLEDSIRYDLLKNTQFYFEVEQAIYKIESDVFFIGNDKGRYEQLKELYQFLVNQNLKVDFKIVGKDKKNPLIIQHPLDYEEIIEKIKKTKCIVEILQKGQSGLTARALEALFYKKKLITTNEKIKDEPFYHPDNIFIIGQDRMDDLKEFINKSCHNIADDIKMQYTYETWLRNFNREEE